ncbi:MAG: hypothetical protein LBF36_01190 [Mycoplasmataceae bacterium]|nr:hypothetical protein [Mycoplasmataceae bacterium]
MTNLNKIFLWALICIPSTIPFMANANKHSSTIKLNNIEQPIDYLQMMHTTTCATQQLMITKGYGDKKDHSKIIRFDNVFKKVYLSPDNHNTNVKSLLSSCRQLTTPTNGQEDYGYFQYSINDNETKKDLNERIEDWNSTYLNNLSTNLNSITNFGMSNINLNLIDSDIWPVNKQLSELNIPCGFRDDKLNRCTFAKVSDAPFDKNNLKNTHDNIMGLPFFNIKEEKIIDKRNNPREHLIAYWLKGTKNIFDINDITINAPLIGCYDLSKLISINSASFNQKSIHLSFNQNFIEKAKQLDEYHQNIKKQLENKWNDIHKLKPDFSKYAFNSLIDMNLLSPNNIDNLQSFLKTNHLNLIDVYTYMKAIQSKTTINFLNSLGFNRYDNPLRIINDLKNKMKLSLNYAISNPLQSNQWIKQTNIFNFSDLENGVDILVGQKDNNICKFRLDSLVSNELDTNDLYIGSQIINKFNLNTDLIKNDDNNIYEIDKPIVTKVQFKNNDPIYNRNYSVNEISNNELLKEYIILKTNYDELGDWTLLNKDQYKITRNQHNATIKISVFLDDNTFEYTYDGFKTASIVIKDIDGSISVNNLIADDLNNEKIRELIKLNGIQSSLIESMTFSIQTLDDYKGTATICIKESPEEDYLNKTFEIFNLKPYFIEQNKKINNLILKKKPSEISENEFKNNFIKMSDEFNNRHINDLSISLQADDNKKVLIANLSYNDIKTNQKIDLTYRYDFDKKFINLTLIIGIIGLSIIGLLTASIFIYKKIRKPKLQ